MVAFLDALHAHVWILSALYILSLALFLSAKQRHTTAFRTGYEQGTDASYKTIAHPDDWQSVKTRLNCALEQYRDAAQLKAPQEVLTELEEEACQASLEFIEINRRVRAQKKTQIEAVYATQAQRLSQILDEELRERKENSSAWASNVLQRISYKGLTDETR